MMKPLVLTLTLTLAAAPAAAGCKVEYKAKRDDPLRLEYGIVEIPQSACTPEAAREHVEKLLAGRGWTLLKILSVRSEE